MADSGGVINGDGGPVREFFGMSTDGFYHSGAAGGGAAQDGGFPGSAVSAPVTVHVLGDTNPGQAPRPAVTMQSDSVNLPGQYPRSEPFTGVDLKGSGQPATAGQYNPGPFSSKHVVPEPGPDSTSGHPNAGGGRPV
jgi:hypothetical protein